MRFAFIIDKIQDRSINKKNLSNSELQARRAKAWFKDHGDDKLRLNYDLKEHSIVFDVGGYKGEFARDIYCKYNSTIYVFEPIDSFYHEIVNRFKQNSKIKIFKFGLGNRSFKANISLLDNASSLFLDSKENVEEVEIHSFNEFIKHYNITQIDLLKLNIEGGEYDLLESIIEAGNLKIIVNLQVQFHDFVIENAKERMDKIYEKLSETHQLTWHYEFVWDNWELKK